MKLVLKKAIFISCIQLYCVVGAMQLLPDDMQSAILFAKLKPSVVCVPTGRGDLPLLDYVEDCASELHKNRLVSKYFCALIDHELKLMTPAIVEKWRKLVRNTSKFTGKLFGLRHYVDVNDDLLTALTQNNTYAVVKYLQDPYVDVAYMQHVFNDKRNGGFGLLSYVPAMAAVEHSIADLTALEAVVAHPTFNKTVAERCAFKGIIGHFFDMYMVYNRKVINNPIKRYFNIIKKILTMIDVNERFFEGRTVLHFLALAARLPSHLKTQRNGLISFLLQNGACPHFADVTKKTAAAMLVAANPNPSRLDNELVHILQHTEPACMPVLTEHTLLELVTMVCHKASNRQFEEACLFALYKDMFFGSSDCSARNVLGFSLLHMVCFSANPERPELMTYKLVLSNLIEETDINERVYSLSPLMLAVNNYKWAVASELIIRGALVTPVGQEGNTVLHYLVNKNLALYSFINTAKIKFFRGDDAVKTCYGRGIDMIIARDGATAFVEELIKAVPECQRVAFISRKNHQKETAFDRALKACTHYLDFLSLDLSQEWLPEEVECMGAIAAMYAEIMLTLIHWYSQCRTEAHYQDIESFKSAYHACKNAVPEKVTQLLNVFSLLG